MIDLPPIYLYIPEPDWPENVPQNMDDFWPWLTSLDISYQRFNLYIWIVQTFLFFRKAGIPCQLTDKIPDDGILIGHRYSFADGLKPHARLLMVCILEDKRQPRDKGAGQAKAVRAEFNCS